MPFSRPTLSELVTRILSGIRSRLTTEQMRRSDAEVYGRELAGASHELHGHIQSVSQNIIYYTAEGEFLERWASIWLSTPRIAATSATGSLTVTGTTGTVLPSGTVFVRQDGATFSTTAEVTLVAGSAVAPIKADTAGQDGNTEAGVVLSISTPIGGIASEATVTAAAVTGGADVEDDNALRARLIDRIQQPPQGGAAADYITWAKEVAGVTSAWVYPLELGANCVTVRFVRDDDANLIPDTAEVAAVQSHIDSKRPVTVNLTVVAPVATPLNFSIAVTPDTATVRAAVESELKDLIAREAVPGGTILLSHIREAISLASGENNYTMTAPAADVTRTTGQLTTFGAITWA